MVLKLVNIANKNNIFQDFQVTQVSDIYLKGMYASITFFLLQFKIKLEFGTCQIISHSKSTQIATI